MHFKHINYLTVHTVLCTYRRSLDKEGSDKATKDFIDLRYNTPTTQFYGKTGVVMSEFSGYILGREFQNVYQRIFF